MTYSEYVEYIRNGRFKFGGMYRTLTKLKLLSPMWTVSHEEIDKLSKDGIIKTGSQGENSNTKITKELL